MAGDHDDLDVADAFARFRQGVAGRVREDDVSTHFDLGVAYAEMGLLADAASEFELVLRHDPWHARARAELMAMNARMGNPPKPGPIGSA